MNILGISCLYHDAAAALLRDGELVAAAHEERFTRKRHDAAIPRHAVAYCLREAGLSIGDVDYLVFYDKPLIKFERILMTYLATFPRSLPSFAKSIPIWLKEKLWIPRAIGKELGYEGEVLFAEHHQSHAASAFYVSGFDEQDQPAVFTVPADGGSATVLYAGAPLVSPTGIHVDEDGVAWVMDHLAASASGTGMLFSIDKEGNIAEVASGLSMGRHGGVSLAPGGTTAVIPVGDEIAGSRLITANTKTGAVSELATPDIARPTGVAAAKNAPVMVVAGESSIHIATFE